MTRPIPQYVDEDKAAAILDLKRGTLANYRSERCGPRWHRPGGMRGIRYRVDELLAWAEQVTVTPEPDARRRKKKATPAAGGGR
jgi:hypothetical protein